MNTRNIMSTTSIRKVNNIMNTCNNTIHKINNIMNTNNMICIYNKMNTNNIGKHRQTYLKNNKFNGQCGNKHTHNLTSHAKKKHLLNLKPKPCFHLKTLTKPKFFPFKPLRNEPNGYSYNLFRYQKI